MSSSSPPASSLTLAAWFRPWEPCGWWWPGADAGFRVRGGASGVSRISARGVLKVRPHTKSGGVVHFRSDTKSGGGRGGNSLQVRYEKWGGGGGGGAVHFRSDIRKVGGRASPLRVRYLCLAHRKYLHVPTYVLPRYTSHAHANELIIHAGKGELIIIFLSSVC